MNYFVFEGTDGSGKTTVLQHVAQALIEGGIEVVLTKEPGGPAAMFPELKIPELAKHIGEPYINGPRYRELCFDKTLDCRVHRAIHRADSLENFFRVVKPALDAGKVVLSDRGWPSDIAYGSVFGGLPIEDMYTFNYVLSKEQIERSTVLWFRVAPEIAEARIQGSNFYDAPEHAAARAKVQKAYAELLDRYQGFPRAVVDANLSIEEVTSWVLKYILSKRTT